MERCNKCDVNLQEQFIKEHECGDNGCSFRMLKAKVCPICGQVFKEE